MTLVCFSKPPPLPHHCPQCGVQDRGGSREAAVGLGEDREREEFYPRVVFTLLEGADGGGCGCWVGRLGGVGEFLSMDNFDLVKN
jgi:hypothetical protein